jgi:cystathionine gamma-lyase
MDEGQAGGLPGRAEAGPAAGRRLATRVVHAGLPDARQGEPFLPGPTLAAPFHLRGEPEESPYVYGRYGNPTWALYERALGELEGGETVLFGSGMAAVAAVLLPALAPRDVLVLPSDGYPAVRELARSHLAGRGVEVVALPSAGAALERAIVEGEGPVPALVWIESPSNPGLDVVDIAAVCHAAHTRGALVAVDNTVATPLAQRPLDLGADFSVASDSKALTGHSDLVLGHVAARDPRRASALREWRTMTGALAGPLETWLAHRSLSTLGVRLVRQQENALALARMLAARPDVLAVRYPGLPDDPAHRLATLQMDGYGGLLTLTLADRSLAERFLAGLELVAEATSFGGVHSSAERRARWGADEVPEGLVRLSAGCEEAEDLVADVAAALERAAG